MSNKISFSFPITVSTTELAGAVVRDRFIRHHLNQGRNVVLRSAKDDDSVQISGHVHRTPLWRFYRMPYTLLDELEARDKVDLGLGDYIPKKPWGETDAFCESCPEGIGYASNVERTFRARLGMPPEKLAA